MREHTPEPSPPPEALARVRIDAMLVEAGWAVQGRAELNLSAAAGGRGIIAAKRARVVPAAVEVHARDEAARARSPRPSGKRALEGRRAPEAADAPAAAGDAQPKLLTNRSQA